MELSHPWLWAHLSLGPLFFLLAKAFLVWPPRKISAWYGYRTPRSMRSQQVWDEAQRYSARAMEWAALLTVVFQVVATRIWGGEEALLASVAFLVAALVAVVVQTERHLKELFDDEGKRKFFS